MVLGLLGVEKDWEAPTDVVLVILLVGLLPPYRILEIVNVSLVLLYACDGSGISRLK